MIRPALAALAALLVPAALTAQAPRPNWSVERTERGTALARAHTLTADLTGLALTCTGEGGPMVIATLPNHRPGTHLSLILRAPDGQLGMLDTDWRQENNSAFWTVRLDDGRFVDLLASANPHVEVTVSGRRNGPLSLAGASASLAEALTRCWQPPAAAAAQGNISGFTVEIVLSPRAAAELQRRNESITLWASYSGMPKPAYARHGNEDTGELDMGQHEVTVPGRAGPVTVPETVLNRRRLSWLTGAPEVLVNVYSARRSGPNNLLDCGIVSGDLATVAGRTHRLRCKLIGEP